MTFESHSVSAAMYSTDDDLKNRSVSELVSILRTAFRTADFDKVEEALVAKEVKMLREIENKNKECELLQNKYEFLRLDRLSHEATQEQLKIAPKEFEECKETSEKLKKSEEDLQVLKELIFKVNEDREAAYAKEEKALEQYEKLLEEVKKSGQDSMKIIEELNSKNSELECAKKVVELDLEHWKRKYEELGHRVSRLEDSYTALKTGGLVASNINFETGACSAGSRELVGKKAAVKDKNENQTGSRIFASGRVVEISDSDDDHASMENLSGVCQPRKRKRAHLDDCEDFDAERNDEGYMNTMLLGESKGRESLEKVGAMLRTIQNGFPANPGFKACVSSCSNDYKKVITSSAAVTLRQCEEKVGAECKSPHPSVKSATCGKDFSCEGCFISSTSDHSTRNEENKGAKIQRSKCNKKWESEAEMLVAFEENDVLCMEAVCALYRQSNLKGKPNGAYCSSRHRGFIHCDVLRFNTLGCFLTNGDPQGNLKKSVMDLKNFDIGGLSDCKRIASEHSNQLFEIYKNKDDRFLFY